MRIDEFDNNRGRCSGHSRPILEIPWDISKLFQKNRSLVFITPASAQTSSGENTDVLALSDMV